MPRLPQSTNASIEVKELGNKDDKFTFIYRASSDCEHPPPRINNPKSENDR